MHCCSLMVAKECVTSMLQTSHQEWGRCCLHHSKSCYVSTVCWTDRQFLQSLVSRFLPTGMQHHPANQARHKRSFVGFVLNPRGTFWQKMQRCIFQVVPGALWRIQWPTKVSIALLLWNSADPESLSPGAYHSYSSAHCHTAYLDILQFDTDKKLDAFWSLFGTQAGGYAWSS